MSLENKVVLITGASSGVGKATAIEFAKKNAKVILTARREEKLKELQSYISSFNENCIYFKADITQENEVINLFNEAEKHFDRVDVLINNAGRGLQSEIAGTTYDDWLSVIHTNLTSVFLCTREALRKMTEKKIKGHIITISSIAGLYCVAKFSAYGASKHGVTGFQRALKWEARKYGIKVSTIHPARIDTEFFDIYNKRPHRGQMLSPKDIAIYIVAIASKSSPKIIGIKILNIFKRIYYLVMYSVK